MKKVPIYAVKCLFKVQLQEDGLLMFCLNGVDTFLCNAHCIQNLSSLEEAKLFFGERPREKRSESNNNDFRDDFITEITERYGAEISEVPGQICFCDQHHEGSVQMCTNNPSCSRILNNIK